MKRSIIKSAVIHVVALLFWIFGLPSFLSREEFPQEQAIVVEMLPLAERSNVKPAPKSDVKEKENNAKPEKAKPPKPVPKQETAQPDKSAVPLPDKKKPQKKPDIKHPPKEQQNKKELESEFNSLMKTLDQPTKNTKKTSTQEGSEKSKSDAHFDPSAQMTMSEIDLIRQQVQKNWSIPVGARDAKDLVIRLRLVIEKDGTVSGIEIVDKSRYGDPVFRVAADSAVRAVLRSSPLKNLPPEKFSAWKDVEMIFDPKDMVY